LRGLAGTPVASSFQSEAEPSFLFVWQGPAIPKNASQPNIKLNILHNEKGRKQARGL